MTTNRQPARPSALTGLQSIRRAWQRLGMTLLLAVMTMAATAENFPEGGFETCEGGAGYIHVSGWAYFVETPDEAIDVRVIVYTNEAMSTRYLTGDLMKTNVLRTDVNEAKGCSGNHGFNVYIPIADAGTYWVKVLAIVYPQSGTRSSEIVKKQQVTVSAADVVTLTSATGDVTLTDGAVLSGTGGADTHVTIADGATVTLMGINITDIPNDGSHRWAGINCAGDATIILADGTTNSVKGGYEDYPGIYVPENKTLTIRGGGTLNASSNGWGAGIGGENGWYCGNIVIDGGIISATGGEGAAGIGGGNLASCGKIDINGGIISATGGKFATGIGGGMNGSCGDITITTGITSLTATKGDSAPYSIGASFDGTCGTVTIGGIETGCIANSPYTVELVTVSFDANGGTGTMAAQTFLSGIAQSLNANTFTPPAEMAFNCWNTEADGSGTAYSDEQSITVSSNTMLYAQWRSKVIDISGFYNGDPTWHSFWASDGTIITGWGADNVRVQIANGATVTLRNAHIAATATNMFNLGNVPGIACVGSATIILEGYNYVEGGSNTSGIEIYSGGTLTISGNGALDVRSGGGPANPNAISGYVTFDGNFIDNSYNSGLARTILSRNPLLPDAADNGTLLGLYNGKSGINVTLSGRTLYKDGAWNTLCLPFAMTAQQVSAQLAPAALMTLGSSTFSGGTLTLNFTDATEIEAGQPYIIRWNKPNGYDGHEAEHDILSPTFTGVTVSKTTAPVETQYVDFVGITSPVTLAANDRSVLYLGAGNQLYWPSDDRPVNAFRGYFQLNNGLEAGTAQARQFVLNFGDGNDATGIRSMDNGQWIMDNCWYDLQGRRLQGQPTKKGLYIHGGKKVVIP